MTSSVVPLCKIVVLILSLSNVHGNSRQQYGEPFYFDYGSLNDPSSTSHNSGAKTVSRIAWGWPFNQQNVVKVMKNPPFISKENENDMPQNDKFIFPEAEPMRNIEQKPHKVISRMGEAPACQGKTFCEDVPNYPTNLLNNVIKNRNSENYESVDAMDIAVRIHTDSTESLCLSTEQIVYPKSAETVNRQWRFVVNHPNFTQGVRVETCMNEGEKCSIIAGFAEGYATTCEQKYIYRQLAAIDEKGSLTQDLFRFPVSCCCNVRFLGTSLRSRLRRSIASPKAQRIQKIRTARDTQETQNHIDTD